LTTEQMPTREHDVTAAVRGLLRPLSPVLGRPNQWNWGTAHTIGRICNCSFVICMKRCHVPCAFTFRSLGRLMKIAGQPPTLDREQRGQAVTVLAIACSHCNQGSRHKTRPVGEGIGT
jgi:hypothetical protein